MSIAQHSVAGEGTSHPSVTENAASLPADAVNLPWVILRAVHHASRLDGIPARARAVLAALARTVDAANPYGQIFARRSLLSERAMQSERTFYRSLSDLELAGLIERPAQRRYVEAGLFGRAYLHLTEHAALLLGLVDKLEEDAVDSKPEAFSQPSDSVADGAIYKDLSPTAFQKRQPGQVPADLQRLLPLGFRDFLIFKLMREAREQGKRLSDVVEATWAHLRKATHPICYLRSLLKSTVDFGHLVSARRAELDAARDEAEKQTEAEGVAREAVGHAFIARDGQRKFTVEAEGQLSIHNVSEAIARRASRGWQQDFVKAIRSGQIRRATDADHEAFAQARRMYSPSKPKVDNSSRVVTASIADHLAELRRSLRGLSRVSTLSS